MLSVTTDFKASLSTACPSCGAPISKHSPADADNVEVWEFTCGAVAN